MSDSFLKVFCYLGRVRFPEQLEPTLALLPDAEREEASTFLAELKEISNTELLRRWSDLRSEEYTAIMRGLQQRGGVSIDDLPPSVREQWVEWLRKQHE